ncbi:MAG: hypothetical protein J0I43_00990 [Microbacterium sp.]|uniref:DUF6264 family protein n=1 Tax=Microbacterium sp. TaxID=51671 RepID=UPI001AC5BCE5|nr:DUF6264 family protein [Microbacterium sp.]MBN9175935.1 hypothetical protein [Microbacterium sp.]
MTGVDDASDPATRPAPQYGEYATPEQQRAAIRQPAASPPPRDHVPPAPAPEPSAYTPGRPMHATTRAAQPTRRADRAITLVLLAYGLVTVISAVAQLWHFAEFADTWMRIAGIDGEFTNTAQGDLWGRIGAALLVLGWVVTALVSWRMLLRGRISWWIPLVGAIVTYTALTACLMVPLFGDPAIAAHLVR